MENVKEQMNVDITGMTCASCSTRIEKILNKMDGVDATVNLAMENASVTFESDKVKPDDIFNKINDLGYGVRNEKLDLDVFGMTCAACSTRIEKVLNKMDGMVAANVNLATESAAVEFNSAILSTDKIIAKIQDLGYDAKEKVQREAKAQQKEEEINGKKRKLFISIL